jgi:hypothetical protein
LSSIPNGRVRTAYRWGDDSRFGESATLQRSPALDQGGTIGWFGRGFWVDEKGDRAKTANELFRTSSVMGYISHQQIQGLVEQSGKG